MRDRKSEHIEIAAGDVERGCAGLDAYRFEHCSLPESDLAEIDISCELFGKKMSAPFIIAPITGGSRYPGINERLARAAEKTKVAMSVGSQRLMLEGKGKDFDVRKHCPSVPLIGNIGAIQLNYGMRKEDVEKAANLIQADAIALHLNPMQEALQPEGQTDFRGLLKKISGLRLRIPLIIKEVGFGISKETCNRIVRSGIKYIDVAGRGGTSFAAIESKRAGMRGTFDEWGVSTADSILNCKGKATIIASGGIRTGLDTAKAIALGADYVSAARPLLLAAMESEDKVAEEIELIKRELRISMFGIGARNLQELKGTKALAKG